MGSSEAREIPDERAWRAAGALHSAAIHLLRRLRREDTAGGLTAPRLSALSVIVFGGPLTLGALATAEQVRAPTMTRIVGALERAGLVAREPDPADARAVLVRATPEGRRLLEAGRDRRTAVLARAIEALDEADLLTLERAASLMEGIARREAPRAAPRALHTPPVPAQGEA